MWKKAPLTEEEMRYQRAKKRVKEIRSFYEHLFGFISTNMILFVIDVLSGGGWWFYWVTVFWGIGLVMHGLNVFTPMGKAFGDEWEERKIQELMGEKAKRTTNDEYFEEEE